MSVAVLVCVLGIGAGSPEGETRVRVLTPAEALRIESADPEAHEARRMCREIHGKAADLGWVEVRS